MPKSPPPSDPAATFTDEPDTGEHVVDPQTSNTTGPLPALDPSADTTGANLAMVPEDLPTRSIRVPWDDDIEPRPASTRPTAATDPKTDETFVELDPTPLHRKLDSQALSVFDVSDESSNPVQQRLLAAELAARETVSGTEEPDPGFAWRVWLASPTGKKWRIGAGVGLALFAACLLAFLFTPAASPTDAPTPRRFLRPDPVVPTAAWVLAPEVVPAAAPIFLDVEVDAGDGAVRIEKREAGVMKLLSNPTTEVIVNGRRLGPTPVFLSAPVGRVELVLESRDAGIYKPVVVTVSPGHNTPRLWDLAHGWLEVIAPAGSTVLIDGRVVGIAPVEQVTLYEGLHRVEVVRPNKTRATSRVEVVARFTITHEIYSE